MPRISADLAALVQPAATPAQRPGALGPARLPTTPASPLPAAKAQPDDSVSLSGAGTLSAGAAASSPSSLAEVEALVKGIRADLTGLSAGAAALAGPRSRLDGILGSIAQIADAADAAAVKRLADPATDAFTFSLTSLAPQIASARVRSYKLGVGESRDVTIAVTQSAQTAALRLSLGAPYVQLGGTNGIFVFQVQGQAGSKQFSFSSGTSIGGIVATVNTFTSSTGVFAVASGTGVRLESIGYGDDKFVRVRVVNPSSVGGSGVVQYRRDNALVVDPQTVTSFTNAINGVIDRGQDIAGTIDGIAAVGRGLSLRVPQDSIDLSINFNSFGAQRLASFRAFNLLRIS